MSKKLHKQREREWLSQKRRECAYHEAGHAVCIILFGNRSDLDHIDMLGTDDVWAFIRIRNHDRETSLGWLDSGFPTQARASMAKFVFFHLLGPCAESKLRDPESHHWEDWLQNLFDEDECNSDPNSDLSRCLDALPAIIDSERKQYRYLEMVARWADEAIAIPRVWSAVSRLAEKLIKVKRLDQEAILAELDAGADHDFRYPLFYELGKNWRRRFFPSIRIQS